MTMAGKQEDRPVVGSALALQRTARRPRSTAGVGSAASTTAGTNCTSSARVVDGWRACRRQVNTCCGVSPCRGAITETTAPGTSVSSTTRALSSLENQRRRPVSVITSSRRAVISDLSVWSSIDTSQSLQRDRQPRPLRTSREGGIRTTLTVLLQQDCCSFDRRCLIRSAFGGACVKSERSEDSRRRKRRLARSARGAMHSS
jgi:hypothetical protein